MVVLASLSLRMIVFVCDCLCVFVSRGVCLCYVFLSMCVHVCVYLRMVVCGCVWLCMCVFEFGRVYVWMLVYVCV